MPTQTQDRLQGLELVYTQLLDRWLREVLFESVYLEAFVSVSSMPVNCSKLRTDCQSPIPEQPLTQQQIEGTLFLLRRCIRIILSRDTPDHLPLTYERIYALCRDAVVIDNKGETLANMLRIELDQSVTRLAKGLGDDISEGVGFALPLAAALTWLEKQVGLLEDVTTYLDRGYLAQTKEGSGIQCVPSSLRKTPYVVADVPVDNKQIVCCYHGSFMIRASTNGCVKS